MKFCLLFEKNAEKMPSVSSLSLLHTLLIPIDVEKKSIGLINDTVMTE